MEKYASCPREAGILDFYAGQFEAVFVLLHPFIHPRNIDATHDFTPSRWPTKREFALLARRAVTADNARHGKCSLHLSNYCHCERPRRIPEP
jgi:hypothetical protein